MPRAHRTVQYAVKPRQGTRLIRSQQAMARQILTGPQRKPDSIIDGVNRNHHIRIGKRNSAGRSRLPQRIKEHIVEKTLYVRRSQTVRRPAVVETHVKRAACEPR